MNHIEIRFYNESSLNDILIAFLSETGFEMFEEREGGLNAYIPENMFEEESLLETLSLIPGNKEIRFDTILIPGQNWNQVWENNFEAVTVDDRVHIRAPFHPEGTKAEYEIIIEPKMSFGTGHHATTAMMVQQLLNIPVRGKSVLDMGCGTSLLAILAAKMGAGNVTAIDIDDWCVENSLENIRRNDVEMIHVHKGDATLISSMTFDVILAKSNCQL